MKLKSTEGGGEEPEVGWDDQVPDERGGEGGRVGGREKRGEGWRESGEGGRERASE